jgi:Virulence factor
MATYKILSWQEIPAQIRAEDDQDEINVPLDPRFQEHIDAAAVERNLQNADDYLAQWNWSDALERDGSAQEVAAAVKAELEAQADWQSVDRS